MDLNEVIKIGVVSAFSGSNYANHHIDMDDVKVRLFNAFYIDRNPDILDKGSALAEYVYKEYLRLGSDELKNNSSFIREQTKLYTTESYMDSRISDLNRNSANHIIEAAKIVDVFDWKRLFYSVYEFNKANVGYVCSSALSILEKFAETDEDEFIKYVRESVFKKRGEHACEWRGQIYRRYIATGHLKLKEARKLRSESSSIASAEALYELIRCKDLYSNYDDMLLLFSDSKYEQVLIILADHLPIHLLYSIMGTQSRYVLSLIEKRMANYNEEKERIENV